MDWAPNMDQTTREWQAQWVCLRCNNHVTGAHPSIQYEGTRPNCSIHGPRQLAIDYRSEERGWICSTGYPPHFHDCQPTLLHEPTRAEPPTTEMPPVANGTWTRQGPPPQHQNTPATHSWFYVPLLLAGDSKKSVDFCKVKATSSQVFENFSQDFPSLLWMVFLMWVQHPTCLPIFLAQQDWNLSTFTVHFDHCMALESFAKTELRYLLFFVALLVLLICEKLPRRVCSSLLNRCSHLRKARGENGSCGYGSKLGDPGEHPSKNRIVYRDVYSWY